MGRIFAMFMLPILDAFLPSTTSCTDVRFGTNVSDGVLCLLNDSE
jgi:hypothetical protein